MDRVRFSPPSITGMSIDWKMLVEKPFDEGYIIEAFASADSIIDDFIESALRRVYNDFKCQDLINEIHLLRGRANFDGLILLEILKSKTIIDEKFYQKVLRFKKARNLVVHNKEGAYALVLKNPRFKYLSQDELNGFVNAEAKKAINNAFGIFDHLTTMAIRPEKNKEYYFSAEFYKKNPRGMTPSHKNKFPK